MRALLGLARAVAVVGPIASADDKKGEKIDAAKLLGRWEPKGGKGKPIEFLKDGTFVMTIPGAGGDFKLDGTYKVEGDKLTTVVKTANAEVKTVITVSKLTDAELTGTDDRGKEDTFVKVTGK